MLKELRKAPISYGDKFTYKGYIGKVTFDGDAKIFFGEVINSQAVITFKGFSVDELRQSFMDSVDAYLQLCKELGEAPEEPPKKIYSGKFTIRLDPDTHRVAAERASLYDISLNEYVVDAIEKQLVNT